MALLNNFWKRHKRLVFILTLFVTPFALLFLLRIKLPKVHVYDRIQAWLIHPLAEASHNATSGVGVLWSRYIALVHASRENEQLKKEVAALHQKILEIEEMGRENERFQKILGMPELPERQGIAAKIIGQDGSAESLSFILNVGSAQGIAPRMPVVHAEGIVGTIVKVFGNSSVFVSFLDPSHDVDGIVTRSRARLIAEGKGKALLARLKYLDRAEDIRVGDLLVTGGLDGVFPKGLPIGHIIKVDKPNAGILQEAELRAAVDPGHLEEVVVLRAPVQKDESISDATATLSRGPQQ